MTVNFETLGVKLDTTGVAEGKQDLAGVAQAAAQAERAAETVGPAYARAAREIAASATAARASGAEFTRQSTQLSAAALSARQYSQALRLLPAQITDVVTSLVSGQSPFLVAIQQGGQIRDSFGGISNSLRALASVITPARLALGLTAGSVAVLGKAYNDAQKESFELTKQIILSGGAAGVTSGQLSEMAHAIDSIVGTRGAAAETLGQLASTGRVASENLQNFAVVAQQLRASVGQPVEETVKIFSELGRAPSEAAFKLNQQINFLTQSQYEQIVAAERLGDTERAAAIAQRAYADEAIRRAAAIEREMPALQSAARGTSSAFKEMWDSITGAFLPEKPETILRRIREERGDRPLFGGRAQFDINLFARDQFEQQLAQQIDQAQRDAQEDARKAQEMRDKENTRQRVSAAIANERIVADATVNARQAGIDRELQNDLAQFGAYEEQLEAQRSAHLISEEDYYDERRKLIEQNRAVQVKALEDENELLQQRRQQIESERDRQKANVGGGVDSGERVAKIETQATVQLIQLKEKQLQLEARIAQLRGQAIAAVNVLETNQTAANKRIEESYITAREAAENYLRTIERRRQREVESLGQGSRRREINEARSDIDDRFEEQRQQLARDLRRGQIQKEQYDNELALLNEFHAKALDATDHFYEELADKQSSFSVGAAEALRDYIDAAANVAEQSQQAFTSAFNGIEDALVNFAQTGKINFHSLADSIIADIIRIQARAALAQIFSYLSGIPSASSANAAASSPPSGISGPRASGGPVDAGSTYLVGERGPELVVPKTSGYVVPNEALRSMGGPRVNVTNHYSFSTGVTVAQLRAEGELIKDQTKAEIAKHLHSGEWAEVMAGTR